QKLIDVTGRGNDTDGNPIGGVTGSVKGGNKVTSTDNAGQYALRDIAENAILVFMYMGKQSQEVSISARTRVNLVLEGSSSTIEEVVAIGYGTARRKDLTGSVASINAEQ